METHHEAVASILLSGLNWQNESDLVSPIWLQFIFSDCNNIRLKKIYYI